MQQGIVYGQERVPEQMHLVAPQPASGISPNTCPRTSLTAGRMGNNARVLQQGQARLS